MASSSTQPIYKKGRMNYNNNLSTNINPADIVFDKANYPGYELIGIIKK